MTLQAEPVEVPVQPPPEEELSVGDSGENPHECPPKHPTTVQRRDAQLVDAERRQLCPVDAWQRLAREPAPDPSEPPITYRDCDSFAVVVDHD